MAARGKSGKAKLSQAERRAQAFDMRKRGHKYDEIGEALGITKQAANRLVLNMLEKYAQDTYAEAGDMLRLELARLDELHQKLWEQFQDGNMEVVPKILSAMDRRVKLLGIEPPQKVAPTNPDGSQALQPVLNVYVGGTESPPSSEAE